MSKRAMAGRSSGYETGSPQRPFQTLLDLSNGPVLPPIAVGTSHNYGATGPTALPREAQLNPIQNVVGVAQRIESGLDDSEQRTSFSAAPSRSSSVSRNRRRTRTKREPTPDDQLMHGLREATESPAREVHSDRTPSPPIQRAVSTDSSPDIPPPDRKTSLISAITNSPMYPKPLRKLSTLFSREEPGNGSPYRDSSVDNASEVSFELERNIHDDELQRTRPSGRGRNLSKAPRRPSGVQIQPTIEEEEEEASSIQPDKPDYVNVPDETWTAEARTVIPSRFQSEPHSEVYSDQKLPQTTSQSDSSSNPENNATRFICRLSEFVLNNGAIWIKAGLALLVSLLLVYAFQDTLCANLSPSPPSIPANVTDPGQIREIRSRMSDMNLQISSMAKELSSAREEGKRVATYPTKIPHNYAHHGMDLQINFLAPSHGAMVDPDSSTPSASYRTVKPLMPEYKKVHTLGKIAKFLWPASARNIVKEAHHPLAALIPWEEAGDCWCSVKESQLSVFLGRAIVPEEVVIEHIPNTATLDPTSAPKVMEMWARFTVVNTEEATQQQHQSGFSWMSPWGSVKSQRQSKKPKPANRQDIGKFNMEGSNSLSDIVMKSLKLSYPHEDPKNYSGDKLLGPNFYRIGKMYYDIEDPNYKQAFALSPIIDLPTIRVDKVVIRVRDNWGSDQTCLYRVKLHGHV